MTRFETIGRIVDCLQSLDDASLEALFAELSGELTDETINVITHGKDDTEHLQSSPVNAGDLNQAMKELKGYKLEHLNMLLSFRK